jgi:hypothetical protein
MAGAVSAGGGAAAAPAPAAAKKSGGALKLVLIVLGVLFVLGIVGVGAVAYIAKRAISNAVQTDASGNVASVNIGGTKIQALKDPALVAREMGVEVFPGATPEGNSASSFTIGGVTTMHAQFSTSSSMDEVFDFYKAQYPDASMFDQPESKMLTRGTEDKELLTINVTTQEDKTLIHVTRITKGN